MKIVGIIREFDSTGRISLPMEMRKQLWGPDNRQAEIFATEDGILIKPYSKQKAFAEDEVTKAIDEFAEEVIERLEELNCEAWKNDVLEIAKRLKGE